MESGRTSGTPGSSAIQDSGKFFIRTKMKRLFNTVAFATLFFVAHAQNKDSVLTSGGKLKPEQAIMDVRHYTIALNVDFNQHAIDGYTTIDVIMAKPTSVLLLT